MKIFLTTIFWASFIWALIIAEIPLTNKMVIIMVVSGIVYGCMFLGNENDSRVGKPPTTPRPPRPKGQDRG